MIIRDLGYSKLDTFKQIAEKEAYFVSRYKPGAIIFDAKNGERIDLLKKLKRKKFVDFEVKIGVKAQMKCRLVAVPVPPEIAQKRREKAKAHRNKKTKHSKAYYDLLDFSIFITNVPEDFWTLKQIMEAYKCRWYIEIIFKGWKSHLKIGKAFPKSKVGEFNVRFLLYASLLMVTLIVMPFFQYLQKRAEQNGKQISILRLCEFISSFLMFMIMSKDWEIIVEMADYHCTYDVRVNRENMIQMIYS